MWKAKLATLQKNFKIVKFPNISRLFNEQFLLLEKNVKKDIKRYKNKVGFLAIFTSIIIFALTIYAGFDLYNNFKIREEVLREKQKVLADVSYWEDVTKEYKGYRDGYFMLTLLYYQLKDAEKVQENLNKVFNLDPNFEKGRELEKLLIRNF